MNFKTLRQYTKARIGLGHVGPGMPTKAWLEFAYAHASATDAVAIPWDIEQQARELTANGIQSSVLTTQVTDRTEYLMRPDLGCLLDDASNKLLTDLGVCESDVLIAASNGLSSIAMSTHGTTSLSLLINQMRKEGLVIAHNRVFLIPNGRVGIIDSLGSILKPKLGIIIIGERPGLSSPDSLAVYLTYQPRHGRVNAERNCISNIRPPHGLDYTAALETLLMLIKESMRKKLSGVGLTHSVLDVRSTR